MNPSRPLWKVSVTTTPEAEDAVAELLGRLFNSAATSYFDFAKQTSRVTAFVSGINRRNALPGVRDGLAAIKNCGLDPGLAKISIAKVRREDWAESWKRHFKPIEIGRTLLIKPGWSKKRPRKGQAVVILNPGLSFGTGQHPTTLFCLEEIARNARPGKNRLSFLDIGTGSGILAIAAARLGYHPVYAMDFDPASVRIAKANAQANRVNIKIFRGDAAQLPLKPKVRFNFVCANLISGLLVAQGKRIMTQLSPGGILTVAGILKPEFSGVQRLFEESAMKLIRTKTKKEWRSGSFLSP